MTRAAVASEAPQLPGGAYSASVVVSGMTFVPDGTNPRSAPATAWGIATVSASSLAELEAEIEQATTGLQAELSEDAAAPSGPAPRKSHTAFGDCGWSKIVLRKGVNLQGYVEGSFSLNSAFVGSAYSTDVLLFSDAMLDGWTAHMMDSGVLSDGHNWKKGTRFSVPKHQDYGATLVEAEVAVVVGGKPGVCQTGGPRVSGVDI